jgi:hypothetical protein
MIGGCKILRRQIGTSTKNGKKMITKKYGYGQKIKALNSRATSNLTASLRPVSVYNKKSSNNPKHIAKCDHFIE